MRCIVRARRVVSEDKEPATEVLQFHHLVHAQKSQSNAGL